MVTPRASLGGLVLASGIAALVSAQSQPPPRFKGTVSVMTVETSAVDAEGRPVRDLEASDFTARLDGKPAHVSVATFIGSETAEGTSVAPASPSEAFVSNAATRSGRSVIIALDEPGTSMGGMRIVYQTAADFIDTLPAADSAGFFGFTSDQVINLTRDHAAVSAALRKMAAGDLDSLAAFNKYHPPNLDAHKQMLAVQGMLANLKKVQGPKYVIWFGEFLRPGDREDPTFLRLGIDAAAAHVTWATVSLDRPAAPRSGFNMEDSGRTGNRNIDSKKAFGNGGVQPGLRELNANVEGTFYQGPGGAHAALAQVTRELASVYEIGVDLDPSQQDGKSHKIELSVTRPGVRLQSRGTAVAAPAAPDEERLLALLHQPSDVTDLPLAVATYALRGAESGTVNLLVTVDVGAGGPVPRPIRWTTALIAADKIVVAAKDTIETTADAPASGTVSLKVPDGNYLLRVAALDATGRGSVFQIPMTADLRSGGRVQMSDLIVGASGSKLRPAPRVKASDGLLAAAQIYGEDPRAFTSVTMRLELLRDGSSDPPRTIMMTPNPNGATILAMQATVGPSSLAPGRYTATATLLVAGTPAGHVSRSVLILP